MDKNNTNKTILIVVIAIVVLLGCMLVSCCAASLYFLSRVDRNKVSELISNAPDDVDIETITTADAVETQTIDGLTADELKIIQLTEETRGITAADKMAPIYKTEEELRQDLIDQLIRIPVCHRSCLLL